MNERRLDFEQRARAEALLTWVVNDPERASREMIYLMARVEKLMTALLAIKKCEAPYSLDRLEHCTNAVELMRGLAARALAEGAEE